MAAGISGPNTGIAQNPTSPSSGVLVNPTAPATSSTASLVVKHPLNPTAPVVNPTAPSGYVGSSIVPSAPIYANSTTAAAEHITTTYLQEYATVSSTVVVTMTFTNQDKTSTRVLTTTRTSTLYSTIVCLFDPKKIGLC